MKKSLLTLFILTVAFLSADARIVTTTMNGNATNPLTWNCLCIPMDGDTIIVNHALTLDVDYGYTLGGVQINAGGSVTGNLNTRILAVGGGYFLNNGTVNVAYIYHSAGTFTNNGTITCPRNLGVDVTAQLQNNGTLNVNDTLGVNTNCVLNNAGTINCPEVAIAGTLNNSGTVSGDNLYNLGTVTHTAGSITLNMSYYNDGASSINSNLSLGMDLWNSGTFVSNYYISAQSLYNGDTISGFALFTNNAMMSVSDDLWNWQTLDGTGDFCVGDSLLNGGIVNGTLDVCDVNGGVWWDINIGSVAGTVTHCSSSCTIGMNENHAEEVKLSPNPADEFITLSMERDADYYVVITDVSGRVVYESAMFGRQMQIATSGFSNGLYTVRVVAESTIMTSRFVKQ
jgi:hypothetical protein